MPPSTSHYSYTEEAFLHSSLQEVVKVWASGSGQAKFEVSIENGVAKLNLSFTLGDPSDLHYKPIYAAQQAPQHVPHDDLQYVPQQQASGR